MIYSLNKINRTETTDFFQILQSGNPDGWRCTDVSLPHMTSPTSCTKDRLYSHWSITPRELSLKSINEHIDMKQTVHMYLLSISHTCSLLRDVCPECVYRDQLLSLVQQTWTSLQILGSCNLWVCLPLPFCCVQHCSFTSCGGGVAGLPVAASPQDQAALTWSRISLVWVGHSSQVIWHWGFSV